MPESVLALCPPPGGLQCPGPPGLSGQEEAVNPYVPISAIVPPEPCPAHSLLHLKWPLFSLGLVMTSVDVFLWSENRFYI